MTWIHNCRAALGCWLVRWVEKMPPLKAQLLLEESLSAYFPEMVFTDSGITVQLHRNTHLVCNDGTICSAVYTHSIKIYDPIGAIKKNDWCIIKVAFWSRRDSLSPSFTASFQAMLRSENVHIVSIGTFRIKWSPHYSSSSPLYMRSQASETSTNSPRISSNPFQAL